MINDALLIIVRAGNAVYNWFIQILSSMNAVGVLLGIISVCIGFRFLIYPMLKPSAGRSDSVKKTKNEEE